MDTTDGKTTDADSVIPDSAFEVLRADEVAECWDGITGVYGLYEALWDIAGARENEPGHKTNEELEEPSPGYCNLAESWGSLSREHQVTLNRLADEKHAADEKMMEKYRASLRS